MSDSRTLSIVLTCVLVIGAVGCSKSSPPASDATQAASTPAQAAATSSPAALPHACTLLTVKDAEDVLGPGAQVTRGSESTCALKDARSDSEIHVTIEELDRNTWDGGETMMTMDKDAKKVTGIGEGGYTYMGGNIVFAKGRAQVTVIVSAYQGPKPKFEAAEFIAKKVAGAL
jgi:hypothetical protein